MPTPKGMRAVQFATGASGAVHIYSDPLHIWLQLRRNVPTEQTIGTPSFKVALNLTPQQAIAIAGELLTAATRKPAPPTPPPVKPTQDNKPTQNKQPQKNKPPQPKAPQAKSPPAKQPNAKPQPAKQQPAKPQPGKPPGSA